MSQIKSKSVKNMKQDIKKNVLSLFYDKEADVLYASRGQPSAKDVSSETEDEVVIRRNPRTGEITGFTVINFSKRASEQNFLIKLPAEISLEAV